MKHVMKHVIVIETADHITFSHEQESHLRKTVEKYTDANVGFSIVYSAFNENSAIAAVHAMFNAPEWTGGAE